MIRQENNAKRGKAARNKGADAERELARIFREKYGIEAHRGKVFYGESDIVGLEGIHPEVKRVEKLNIHSAMRQAKAEAVKRGDGLPAVFFRRDREEWLVALRLDDFMEMYKAWRKNNDSEGI